MRICIVNESAYPFMLGGGQHRLYEVGYRLASIGWQVDWVTFQSWKGNSTIKYHGINYIGIQSLPSFFNKKGKRNKTMPIIFFFRILQNIKLIKNYDVVWTGHWPLLHLLPIILISWLYKIHLIVDWWEVWGLKTWSSYSSTVGWIGYLLEISLIRLVSIKSDIVTDCKLEATRISKKTNKNSFVHVISNGIPRNDIGDVDLSQNPEFDIVSLGRLKNHKRVDLLLRALWHLRENYGITAKTAIIGDGPERNNLEKLSQELKLDEQVKFYGIVPELANTYEILKKSKICVITTVNGGGGNLTLLEAYGCGLPVIAFKVKEGIDPSLIEHGKSGLLVDTVNEEKLAENIASILSEDRNILEMKKYVFGKSKEFDWDRSFQIYLEILKKNKKV